MNAEKLIEMYDRVAEAPDAIPRLRRFVLDLAVRGKLVEQEAGDEPATELVKRIAELKSALANSGAAVRSSKSLTVVDEPPFELPRSWHWAPVRSVTRDRGQTVPRSAFTYIDVTAIDKEAGIVAEPRVLEAVEAPSRARKITEKGDVIYSCVRPYLLNVAVIEQDFNPPAIASTAFAVLDGLGMLLPRYLWIALRSPYMVSAVENCQRGQAYPAINDSDFAALPLPVPPLAEQHRIVARVDELMTLLDRLEAARGAREATRDRFTTASLTRLTAPDPDTRVADAQSTLDALPALTTRTDQIKQLRETILELAVNGKLLSSSHKARCRLREFRTLQNGYAFKSEWFTKSGVRLLRNANVGHGCLNWEEPVHLSEERAPEFARFELRSGDVVLSLDRPFISTGTKVARVSEADLPCLLLQRVGRFEEKAPGLSDAYLFLWVNSPDFSRQINPGRSNGVPHISSRQVEEVEVVVPSLVEQHRIVAKVDELMALCDRLEAALTTADTTRARLLEALLHEALAPAMDEVA